MASLKRIEFRRYKKLDSFTVSCGAANILVGPNNAGKSSILDALRIFQDVQRYARRLRPQLIRSLNGDAHGYEIPDASLSVNIANVIHNYGDEDATIQFVHENGRVFTIEINPEHLTRAYVEDSRRTLSTGKAYFEQFPVEAVIVPTLSPFEVEETYVTDETVDRNRSGRLASRHFRNAWYRSTPDDFNKFADIISRTWQGVTITRPARPYVSDYLEMFYREGRYEREVSWSGFGFQVWLQIVTHMLRASPTGIFVLDEPDIYLHPDLQARLLELVRERFSQFFLATHSAEIINHSQPGDIVSVDSKNRAAKRVKSDADYNRVFSDIGSIQNVELSKLARAKRVIFFEGKDKSILTKLSLKAGFHRLAGDGETLVIGVGGFGQWKRVVEAAWTFRSVLQVEVRLLAVFDRDYRHEWEIKQVIDKVGSEEVECIVWGRKEIENYLLVPRSLTAAVIRRARQRNFLLSEKEAEEMLRTVSDEYKHEVSGQVTASAVAYERGQGSGKDIAEIATVCGRQFEKAWSNLDDRFRILPGKKFIGSLSAALQQAYRVSITENMLIEEMKTNDIDSDLADALAKIDAFCKEDLC